jgi:hypothetical protein
MSGLMVATKKGATTRHRKDYKKKNNRRSGERLLIA